MAKAPPKRATQKTRSATFCILHYSNPIEIEMKARKSEFKTIAWFVCFKKANRFLSAGRQSLLWLVNGLREADVVGLRQLSALASFLSCSSSSGNH
jgi:hypothetical protein